MSQKQQRPSIKQDISECYYNNEHTNLYCKREAEELGLEFSSEGRYRAVFSNDNSEVIKFALGEDGVESNRNEYRHWNRDFKGSTVEDHFVPVKNKGNDDKWITMDRAENDNVSSLDVGDLMESLISEGWRCDDINPFNVGRHDGEVKILDYGDGCHRTR